MSVLCRGRAASSAVPPLFLREAAVFFYKACVVRQRAPRVAAVAGTAMAGGGGDRLAFSS